MKIVLLKSTVVRGRQLLAGEEIDCPEKEGKLWCALAWARAKDLVTEDEEPERRGPGRPKGSYKRRDMRAEE